MLGLVGGGYGAFWLWRKHKLNAAQPGTAGAGVTAGNYMDELPAVQGAANDSTGSGSPTNVYDAVLGVADIIGGVVNTGMSQATGDVADDISDVVDRAATIRVEGL